MSVSLKETLSKGQLILDLYDKELENQARLNNGMFDLSDENLHVTCNKVLSTVYNKPVNLSWSDCQAIFDMIERQVE